MRLNISIFPKKTDAGKKCLVARYFKKYMKIGSTSDETNTSEGCNMGNLLIP